MLVAVAADAHWLGMHTASCVVPDEELLEEDAITVPELDVVVVTCPDELLEEELEEELELLDDELACGSVNKNE